jgi:hypothetical protein
LAGHSFESADALFGAVQGILEGIENVTLQAVFLDWMERLGKCLDSNGVYVDLPKINLLERKSFTRPVLRFSATRETPHHFNVSHCTWIEQFSIRRTASFPANSAFVRSSSMCGTSTLDVYS